MFSFFSNLSNPFSNPFRTSSSNNNSSSSNNDEKKTINLKSVHIYDIENPSSDDEDKSSSQALKHLVKLNHIEHSILFHQNLFHNHLPHILGSAFLFSANSDQLHKIYAEESRSLEPWQDSPGEVSVDDWRDYLGDARYARAYVDFFEDQVVLKGYDWRKVVEEYLFTGPEPLINSLISGLGHPLIHLGYAYELSSREVAMEALGLATSSYNSLHKYLDDPKYTRPSSYSSSSPLEILQRIATDPRLDALKFTEEGPDNIEILLNNDNEALILEHWNALHISNLKTLFEDGQKAAAAILVATHDAKDERKEKYDFFLVHILTTSHAVRILLPLIPSEYHLGLVRQWWFLTIMVYIAQLRPQIKLGSITDFELGGRGWEWVNRQAVEGKYATDAHYVKGLRSLKEAANTWGDKDDFYLKGAVRLGSEFNGWGGFGASERER